MTERQTSQSSQPPATPAREAALHVVASLQRAGHVAYFAGGCVRDDVLGLTPKDYDVATDARPEQVRKVFPHAHAVGEAFGVLLVHVNRHAVEVATFRVEWGYRDHRHPSHVEFSDAQHDALRRDFTINGLFENPLADRPEDRVIDYVGGLADLEARIVRAIGDPHKRFDEDYLRMLRAVRFSTRPGFTLDPQTADAIRQLAPRMAGISRERIGLELASIAAVSEPAHGLELIQSLKLDGPVLDEPPQHGPLPTVAGLSRQRDYADRAGHEDRADYPTVLAAWLLDRHLLKEASNNFAIDNLRQLLHESAPRIVRRWRAALLLSNDHRDSLVATLNHLPAALDWSNLPLAKKKRLMATGDWARVSALVRAMAHVDADNPLKCPAESAIDEIERESPELIRQGVCPPPLLTGHDLISQGRKPGPDFRRLLEAAYDLQLEGILTNHQEALYWLASQS